MYSGQQMAGTIAQDLRSFEQSLDGGIPRDGSVKFLIAVPFVSTLAMNLVEHKDWRALGLPPFIAQIIQQAPLDLVAFAGLGDTPSPEMQSFAEAVFVQSRYTIPPIRPHITTEFSDLLNDTHVLTYFAHKLADDASVPNTLFAGAPYISRRASARDKKIVVRGIPLIQGCNIGDYITDVGKPFVPGKPARDFKRGTCPPTYYKTLTYIHEGTDVLPMQNIVDFLEREVGSFGEDDSDSESLGARAPRQQYRLNAEIAPGATQWWADHDGTLRSVTDGTPYCSTHGAVGHYTLIRYLTKTKDQESAELCPFCAATGGTSTSVG